MAQLLWNIWRSSRSSMWSRVLCLSHSASRISPLCSYCPLRYQIPQARIRTFLSSRPSQSKKTQSTPPQDQNGSSNIGVRAKNGEHLKVSKKSPDKAGKDVGSSKEISKKPAASGKKVKEGALKARSRSRNSKNGPQDVKKTPNGVRKAKNPAKAATSGRSLKEAMLVTRRVASSSSLDTNKEHRRVRGEKEDNIDVQVLVPDELDFEAVDASVPPIPMLSWGLDRVLFNSGIYRLQDPHSRLYNFDPYLQKIMAVQEFDFEALSEYKTSSKDDELLRITKQSAAKFTGSTSSMSGILQHFHYLLSNSRKLDHSMLSRSFPAPNDKFSKVTLGPSAAFLRWKDGVYAIDADKSYDTPNIMSWLGHSLEKLLTTDRNEFERYRRSNPEQAPKEDKSARCFHYSRLGNFLVRSQLDAYDPRLPGSGVFDVKTRAVVSIRMDHDKYEHGAGYQLRFDRGEWESFEREFYDMTRATMLKYSLQVRMGRMDGIFVAYHNIERIFGFQYLSRAELDQVLHGQSQPCLGDLEFKASIQLLDELLQKAIERYPEQTLRLHVHARSGKSPFMYIFAEPMTPEEADKIQASNLALNKAFERNIVGVKRDDPEVQADWQGIQDRVDHEMDSDGWHDPAKDVASEEHEDNSVSAGEISSEAEGSDSVMRLEDLEEDSLIEEDLDKNDSLEDEESDIEQDLDTEATSSTDQDTGSVEDSGAAGYPSKEERANNEDDSAAEGVNLAKGVELSRSPKEEGANADILNQRPLIGWTLAVRNRVNGEIVDRPTNLKPSDEWKIEYHIQEIPKDTQWSLYEKIKAERCQLHTHDEGNASARRALEVYRATIRKHTDKGRKWRDAQDKVEEKYEKQIFEPLGPGSPAAATSST